MANSRPHFHLLVSKSFPLREIQKAWRSVLNSSDAKVTASDVHSQRSVNQYLIKKLNSPQNIVPATYRNMGRFWGCKGLGARPTPLLEISASEEVTVPVRRLLRSLNKLGLKKLNPRGKPRPDKGCVGHNYRFCGGEGVAKAVERVLGACDDVDA